MAVCSRQWRRLDLEEFRSALSTSRLCQPDCWPADIDEMAVLYDVELNGVLDQLLPVRRFTRRPRPSDPWFNKECCDSKRLTRRLECAYAADRRRSATTPATSAAVTEVIAARWMWYNQRRLYRQLRHCKCTEFWRDRIEADQSDPRKLWKSVDVLLGCG